LPENEFLNADLNSLMAELITVTSQLPMALFELELVKESPADSRDQFDEAIFKKRQEIFDIFTRMREVYFSLIRTGRRKFSVR
jgi:hypothetical protein